VKVDVRIIATSNRDLEAYVKSGGFREDLYFRLNVVNLRLPSLRERPVDLPALAQFFADKYADANAVSRKKISAAATQKMKSYGWRGNIRELENTMHRAILVSMEDEIEADAIHIDTPGHLSVVPKEAAAKAEAKPVQNSGAVESLIGRSVAAVERDLIINTLEHCLGNRTHAANILGISIRTLRNKLNQYKDEGVNIPASATGE
jgi:two-component system response regulator FlrC